MCERERESERERGVYVCVFVREKERGVYVCACERERERVCV